MKIARSKPLQNQCRCRRLAERMTLYPMEGGQYFRVSSAIAEVPATLPTGEVGGTTKHPNVDRFRTSTAHLSDKVPAEEVLNDHKP